MLPLASTGDDLDIHRDPEAIWRPWVAGELRSRPIHSGHHQAEDAPGELASALLEVLGPNSAERLLGDSADLAVGPAEGSEGSDRRWGIA